MEDDGWRQQPKRMSDAVIDGVVRELARLSHAQDHPLSVVLHGGEPLMLGMSRMARLLSALRKALRPTSALHLQTNGVLLSHEFIDLLARHDVGVSISYDGPTEVHDRHRKDQRARGSRARVLAAIDRLRRHPAGREMFTGVLAVVDPESDPSAVYQSLKDTGAPGLDFLYLDGHHDRLPRGKASFVSTEVGEWMTRLLAIYLSDSTPPKIRVLDDLMRLILGGAGRKEGVGLTEYGIIVIDTDGTITKNDTLKVSYQSGDRFSESASIVHDDLLSWLSRSEVEEYHHLQVPTAEACRACPELRVCGGGMPAHRWSAARGFDNPTVFCADQKLLISHMRRYLANARRTAPNPAQHEYQS